MYVGTSSGGTKEVQFVGESSGSLINGNISLGSIVTLWYTDMLWRIVHIDETNNEVVLTSVFVDVETVFNNKNVMQTYNVCHLRDVCGQFLNSLPQFIQNSLIPKTVHGAIDKVWVPQVNWVSTTSQPNDASGPNNIWTVFDYFAENRENANVTGIYNVSNLDWWTASFYDENGTIWKIRGGGSPQFSSWSSNNVYFRPFICLPLS